MMKEHIEDMMIGFKQSRMYVSRIEKDLGFSNGTLSKGILSDDKFKKLQDYYCDHVIGSDKTFVFRIYKLTSPLDDKIFYVGCTRRDLTIRLKDHISESIHCSEHTSNRTKKQSYVKEILNGGGKPIIELLEEVSDSSMKKALEISIECEKKWIIFLHKEGNELCNLIPREKKEKVFIKGKRRIIEDIFEYCTKSEILLENFLTAHIKLKEENTILKNELTKPSVKNKEHFNTEPSKEQKPANVAENDLKTPPSNLKGIDLAIWKEENLKS